MIKSYLRGHEIEYTNNEWVYSDNKQPTAKTHKSRPCGKCGNYRTEQGHDSCLGTLKGLMNACCGHGKNKPYIQFKNGFCIYGRLAKMIINILN